MFLMWYDSDRKKPAGAKIDEGIERFVEKYGHQPTVVLVNPAEPVEGVPLPVITRSTVGRHYFFIGDEAVPELSLAGAA